MLKVNQKMDLKELLKEAKKVKSAYSKLNKKTGKKEWGVAQYAQGFVGDIGDLSKLIMVKEGFRIGENVDEKLAHELSDCLWSILIIADELDVNLEKEYLKTMKSLLGQIKAKGDKK